MSWADVIKRKASQLGLTSKAAELKPEPRLRWFGKLPTYADYYSSPASEEWEQEFNDWVLQGYALYNRRLLDAASSEPTSKPAGIDRLPPSEFVLRLPKSKMTVLASIQDYGGDMRGRHFPICFYVGLPTAGWPGPTSDHVAGAARAIRELMDLRQLVMRFCNSPGQFEAVFGKREVDLSGINADHADRTWADDAKTISLEAWFERAKAGLKMDEANAWFRSAEQWGRSIVGNESDRFEPTLRFPLAPRMSFQTQLAGWLCWLEKRMDLRRRNLSLVVRAGQDGGNGQFTVIAREIIADDFLLATPLSGKLAYVDALSDVGGQDDTPGDLGAGGAESGAVPVMAGHWQNWVDSPT